jgi:hypothetical protein
MPSGVTLLKSHERKKNYLEGFIEQYGIHVFEDFLRDRLILRQNKLSKFETIIFARILWGRNLNAINENKGRLDMRHLKAEVINMSCLVIHIQKNKNYLTSDLLKLLVHHTAIIREHLKYVNDIKSMNAYNVNHYDYCVEWFKNCVIILENKESDQEYISSKIEEIRDLVLKNTKSSIIFDYDKLNKCIVNISVDDFL